MAKQGMIQREHKRDRLVAKHAKSGAHAAQATGSRLRLRLLPTGSVPRVQTAAIKA